MPTAQTRPKPASRAERALGGCASFATSWRVAHPSGHFLVFDERSPLDDTTAARQRRVTGSAFPGGRPFALFEGAGFWFPLDSMARKLIRIYGRGHRHFMAMDLTTFQKISENTITSRSVPARRQSRPAHPPTDLPSPRRSSGLKQPALMRPSRDVAGGWCKA